GNSAQYGGAIGNEWGDVTVTNSTFNGNVASGDGGAIVNDSPAFDYQYSGSGNTLTLTNCTIAGNTATGSGGGIANYSRETVTMTNTMVAGNAAAAAPDVFKNSGVVNATYSLIGKNNGSGITGGTGNQFGTNSSPLDPLLAPLGAYGGPTATMPLLAGSPAL